MINTPFMNLEPTKAKQSSKSRPGVGHPSRYQVSRQKQEANERLPYDSRLSLADMQKAERIKHGCAPYDPYDTSVANLIDWDYHTNSCKDEFEQMYTCFEQCQYVKQWLNHMKVHNYWCSFFIWFHGEAHKEIPFSLQRTQFSEKVRKMYYGNPQELSQSTDIGEFVDPDEEMPQIENLHIEELEYELVDLDDHILDQHIETEHPEDLSQAIIPYQPSLHSIVEDLAEKQAVHKWTTAEDKDGNTREVPTIGDIPPWESLLEKLGDNKFYRLYACQKDREELNIRNVVAGINWTNTFVHKWHKIDTKKINAIGRILEDNVLKTCANIDNNLPTFLKNVLDDSQHKSEVSELNQDRILAVSKSANAKLISLHIKIDDLDTKVSNSLKEVNEMISFLKQKKEESILKKNQLVPSQSFTPTF